MAEASLDLLQAMMQRMLDGLGRLEMRMSSLEDRVTGVEHQIAAVRRDLVLYGDAFATLHGRMDRMDSRIERIERRLDLNDA
jgi:uncharacterized coiled-coil protein SlyX